jgi:5'-nucleotidase
VARALPPGSVDVIVAGHSHQGVAHRVNGIAIIESYAKGVAFGRVDATVVPDAGVSEVRIHPPRFLCEGKPAEGVCKPGEYEGVEVVPDAKIAEVVSAPIERSKEALERPLGVTMDGEMTRSRTLESPMGNLFADLMRVARPRADVALINGGGLRANLPAGNLTYGALYEAIPFDNRFAFVRMTGAQLRALLADNMRSEHGIFSLSGIRATAQCREGKIVVDVRRDNGHKLRDNEVVVVATNDFVATGGDGAIGRLGLGDGAIEIEDGEPIRDAIAAVLQRRGGTLRGNDRTYFNPRSPRFRYPGKRPMSCP